MFRSLRPDSIETRLGGRRAAGALPAALFRSLRPDFIETNHCLQRSHVDSDRLFRSPRPDFIETPICFGLGRGAALHCSGLQDRTSLRRDPLGKTKPRQLRDCSGLQDRTSLRRTNAQTLCTDEMNCSGLQDRTSLRHIELEEGVAGWKRLFRSPRPDFIETGLGIPTGCDDGCGLIVPVSKTGLH